MTHTNQAFLRESPATGSSRPRFAGGLRGKIADPAREHAERIGLGAMLSVARRRKGLPQGEVAREIGVTQCALSSWEKGKRPVPPEARVRLVALYGMDPTLLAGLDLAEVAVTPDERVLLAGYRACSNERRHAALALVSSPHPQHPASLLVGEGGRS